MKQELSLEVVHAPGNEPLIQVVRAVCAVPWSLECFVWSAIPNTGEARIWVTLPECKGKMHELIMDLGRIPSLRRVVVHGTGQSSKEALQ